MLENALCASVVCLSRSASCSSGAPTDASGPDTYDTVCAGRLPSSRPQREKWAELFPRGRELVRASATTSKGIWLFVHPIIIKHFENAPLLSIRFNQLYTYLIFYLYYKN